MFRAYIQGYSDRLFDQQLLTVQAGYWAAYYTNAKHPKPLKTLISDMSNRKAQNEIKKSKSIVKPEVDVEAFLATEEQFLRKLKSQ